MRRQKNFASSISVARSALRFSGVALAALSLGACSSDMSRFAGNPFSNPFASNAAQARDPVSTGSLAKSGAPGARAAASNTIQQVQAAPLSPLGQQQIPQQVQQPLQQAQQLQQQAPQGVSPAMERAAMQTGSLGTMPASSALRQASPVVRPVSARAAGVTGNAAGWTAQGGTPVVLAHGETIDTLSQRYGVPAAAITASNGLSSPSQATPGSRIVIPVFNVEATKAGGQRVASASTVQSDADISRPVRNVAAAAPATDPVRPVSRPPASVAQPAAQPQQRGMTAAEIRAAAQAKAKLATDAKAPEQKPSLSADAKAKQAAEAKEKAASAAKAKLEAKAKADADAKAKAEAKAAEQGSRKVAALPAEEPKTTSSVPKEAEKAEPSKAEFRWPARGRIINGFSGRGGNEGINIAVPEGTPVKAAEGGTVAYAGSELKGYGNLVLIRHDNGYVSAYAHNGDINVKRGEKVSRGQVIAKSGQSGNVSSPQLHFELRKGSSPVDPTPYLTN
jgi:murein DD-endopeptidase MepM/ murein hydrolase activator NlpD